MTCGADSQFYRLRFAQPVSSRVTGKARFVTRRVCYRSSLRVDNIRPAFPPLDVHSPSVIQAQRPVGIARVAATTALEAKKKGKGGGNNEGAQPRERKEKDDVIEVGRKLVAPHPSSKRIDRL